MTKTKILTGKWRSSLKRADVRRAIREVYGDELNNSNDTDESEKQAIERAAKNGKKKIPKKDK